MSTQETTSTPLHLLRDHLRTDSRLRERSIAKFIVAAALVSIPFTLAMREDLSWPTTRQIIGLELGVASYEALLVWLFRRGWYHPAVAWVNVLIEVSLPILTIGLLSAVRGTDFYAASSLYVLWTALICFTALRANPRLCLLAGGWAAALYLTFYYWTVVPDLPAHPITSLQWPATLLRACFLVMAGVMAASMARHFIRKAENALRSVREQDLMGKYFLHERLGAGGMAEVFRATYCPQGGFQKPVAIKRVLPKLSSNSEFTELFLEEAALCAMLAHPNIVQVFDCGRFQNTFILAMELVDGASLRRILKRGEGRLPLSAVTYLGAELAAGLEYLHRRTTAEGRPLNLVHRDVNPPNLLVSRLGEVKLADFGVARAATRVKASQQGFYGKTFYAAPEQFLGESYDGRADLFALGLTLHEALTGEPVLTSSAEALLRRGQLPLLVPPSRKRPDVPPALDALIMQMLSPDPYLRPATGAEVRQRLTELTGDAAPYPAGQKALARAVESFRARAQAETDLGVEAVSGTVTQLDGGGGEAARPQQETRALRLRR